MERTSASIWIARGRDGAAGVGNGPALCAHDEPNPHGKPTPAMVFAESAKTISTTPIPKLDLDGDGSNSAVTPLERIPRVDEDECVGCNLCSLVCPVPECITMERARRAAV
jgi:dihydropyrimidine dehydrogenase (NAD+) subunit PreA